MRAELSRLGIRELREAADVDAAVASEGTVLIVVNSVCGCAAGKARPGIAVDSGTRAGLGWWGPCSPARTSRRLPARGRISPRIPRRRPRWRFSGMDA